MARWALVFALVTIAGVSALKSVKAQEDSCETKIEESEYDLRAQVRGCLEDAKTLEEAQGCGDV